jgi:hypothetical protein
MPASSLHPPNPTLLPSPSPSPARLASLNSVSLTQDSPKDFPAFLLSGGLFAWLGKKKIYTHTLYGGRGGEGGRPSIQGLPLQQSVTPPSLPSGYGVE